MKKVLVLVLLVFAMGCAKKYGVAYKPEPPVKPEQEKTEEMKEAKPEKAPKEVEVVEEKVTPKVVEEALQLVKESPAVLERKEVPFELKDVLFDYDKYDIRADAKEVLDSTMAWFIKNKPLNIVIEGHCDERGTNEYNLALGEKRANAVKNYLIANGVVPARISTISYGEEKPLCSEQNEECWQRNRRAHFVATK